MRRVFGGKEIIMSKVNVNKEICKGCELCIKACPKNVLAMNKEDINKMGYHYAQVADESKCIACCFCAVMCPDCVITVEG